MLCEGALEKPKFFCARIRSSNFFALLILPFTKSHFAHPTARRACGAKVWAGALLAADTPKKNPTRRKKGPSAEWRFSARKKFSSVAKRDPDIPRPIPKNSEPPFFGPKSRLGSEKIVRQSPNATRTFPGRFRKKADPRPPETKKPAAPKGLPTRSPTAVLTGPKSNP